MVNQHSNQRYKTGKNKEIDIKQAPEGHISTQTSKHKEKIDYSQTEEEKDILESQPHFRD